MAPVVPLEGEDESANPLVCSMPVAEYTHHSAKAEGTLDDAREQHSDSSRRAGRRHCGCAVRHGMRQRHSVAKAEVSFVAGFRTRLAAGLHDSERALWIRPQVGRRHPTGSAPRAHYQLVNHVQRHLLRSRHAASSAPLNQNYWSRVQLLIALNKCTKSHADEVSIHRLASGRHGALCRAARRGHTEAAPAC